MIGEFFIFRGCWVYSDFLGFFFLLPQGSSVHDQEALLQRVCRDDYFAGFRGGADERGRLPAVQRLADYGFPAGGTVYGHRASAGTNGHSFFGAA